VALGALLVRYIEALVYQGLVENIACEQSSRMIAMKSATDNAGDMVKAMPVTSPATIGTNCDTVGTCVMVFSNLL
jgi:hypothetical protein